MAIHFSEEQKQALVLFENGVSFCLTGPGGTGKSLLIREMYCRGRAKKKTVCVTALTGCAAYLLVENGARTIHSWSGVYRYSDQDPTPTIISNYVKLLHKKRKTCMERWLSTDVLIIDEISMMSSHLFTLLDGIGKELRSQGFDDATLKEKSFGGMQVVVVGDFLQIPPVEQQRTLSIFECKAWRQMIRKRSQVVALRHNFRAHQDTSWASMLSQLRQGDCSKDVQKALESRLLSVQRVKEEHSALEIKPTVLVSTHLQVDAMNIANLQKCPKSTEVVYTAVPVRRAMKESGSAKDDGVEVAVSDLAPREREAWKEAVENSLIPYSLVLRQNAQVMCLSNLDIEKGLVNGARGVVVRFDTKTGYPVIRWKSTSTGAICKPILLPTRHPLIFMKQIPLCQAWAITIHKSQGQTLDCAEVDIGSSVFVPGQAYVALSRIRSLDSLYLRNFNQSSIWADPYAKRFCVAIGDV